MAYAIRKSAHIQQDIQRNWSSWNFGQEGIEATEEQIETWKQEAIENGNPFCISGFELYGDEIANSRIEELYTGYWVLVDTRNIGISCNIIDVDFVTAKNDIENICFGSEQMIDCSEWNLIWSSECGEYHIFEEK